MTTKDLRVEQLESLSSPEALQARLPITPAATRTVLEARGDLRKVMSGEDPRLVVIVGPCSIHDPEAARDYATRLRKVQCIVDNSLLIIMRVYFEKPRTTVGWKGLINDPSLDGSCDINRGLGIARELLLDINNMGLPCATEFLDPIVPQYISDLVSWAAIGARTTESQTHREMASGLSMPVGFKNATDGDLQIALNGMTSARQSHAFLGITPSGTTCVVRTKGNPDVHLVLRGGDKPNFSRPHIAFARASLEEADLRPLVMVDCSHGNSNKDHRRQANVFQYLLRVRKAGEQALFGMMLESNIVEGRQEIAQGMAYGKSVTDACIGWEQTESLLLEAHEDLQSDASRRKQRKQRPSVRVTA